MANHTSLRVGGPADIFFIARSTSRLTEAIDLAVALGIPWRIIGAASNLLIADEGVAGLVVKAGTQSRSWALSADGSEATVHAEAGCILASLARQLAQEGLEGLEWAANVPGTVGAAIVNNSGAFGSSIAAHLLEASLHVPGEGPRTATPEQLEMAYRTSLVKRSEPRAIILGGSFRVTPARKEIVRERMRETQRKRQETQPTGPSLGSMFANPSGDAAGRLIEAAGLKGATRGSAEISKLHANFVLNRGSARARDVLDLMMEVQRTVWEQNRQWLVPEVQLVGRWHDEDRMALRHPPGSARTFNHIGMAATERIRPVGASQ
jgi:UDP-N-acetylmuramate dehydrogenase